MIKNACLGKIKICGIYLTFKCKQFWRFLRNSFIYRTVVRGVAGGLEFGVSEKRTEREIDPPPEFKNLTTAPPVRNGKRSVGNM